MLSNSCFLEWTGNFLPQDPSLSTMPYRSSFPYKLQGGKDWALTVELPFRISWIVRKAATVLLNMPPAACTAGYEPSCDSLWACPVTPKSSTSMLSSIGTAGKVDRRVSQSLTSSERSSVEKNGCKSTRLMKGRRRTVPVRLSCFFNIFTSPVQCRQSDVQAKTDTEA